MGQSAWLEESKLVEAENQKTFQKLISEMGYCGAKKQLRT